MDTPLVNGVAYPTVEVDPAVYRFLLLNGTNDRMMTFNLFVARARPRWLTARPSQRPSPAAPMPMGRWSKSRPKSTWCLPRCLLSPAPGVTRPLPTAGAPGGVCTPTTWPTDARNGGVPDPDGVGPTIYQFANEGGLLPKVAKIEPTPLDYL